MLELDFVTFETMKIAIMLIKRVITNNINPRPINADSWKSPDASLNSFAIILDKVWLGENKVVGIADKPTALPIIIVTKIVSPMALPNPKKDAPNKPDFP